MSTTASTSCSMPTCGRGPHTARRPSTSSSTPADQGHLPHNQCPRPLGLPGQQPLRATATRPRISRQSARLELIRLAAGVPDLAVKILGIVALDGLGPRGRALSPRPHLPRRRRRPRDAADRRLRPQHRRPGRPQSRLEARQACLRGAAADPACSAPINDERQPVGRAITDQSLANAFRWDDWADAVGTAIARPEYLERAGHDLWCCLRVERA